MYSITKPRLIKYIENFTTQNWKFSDKNFDFMFLNILLKTTVLLCKVGFKAVKIIQVCFCDVSVI